jgi:hypothetical protein
VRRLFRVEVGAKPETSGFRLPKTRNQLCLFLMRPPNVWALVGRGRRTRIARAFNRKRGCEYGSSGIGRDHHGGSADLLQRGKSRAFWRYPPRARNCRLRAVGVVLVDVGRRWHLQASAADCAEHSHAGTQGSLSASVHGDEFRQARSLIMSRNLQLFLMGRAGNKLQRTAACGDEPVRSPYAQQA